ncbi:MAG: universal stress protein [Marinilabiliaceae bacterium]|nr:universal stress protein [Marinilabiliaceae bacterium]
MKLLEKILVPLSFNASNDQFIDYVGTIAQQYNSEIIFLAVLPEDAKAKSIVNIVMESVTTRLMHIKEKIKPYGVRVNETIMVYGDPVDHVIVHSRLKDVNVICLTSDFFTDGKKEGLGVYSEKIIRRAEKPVWVYNFQKEHTIKKILCPVDYSPASKRALSNAMLLAKKFNAELTVFSVFVPLRSLSIWIAADLETENKRNKEDFVKEIEYHLKQYDFRDSKMNKVIVDGQVDEEILTYLQKEGTDLLIMGTTGKNSIGKALIGSVTQEVVRKATCSFITIKSTDIINFKLENEIKNIEIHVELAKQLEENGLYEQAIHQYEICLRINSMHIPSLYSISKLYNKLGKQQEAKSYETSAEELMKRIWDKKIEAEIRSHYKN